MSIDHDGDQILANAHRGLDPNLAAAATRYVLAHGEGDLLPMILGGDE